jgi:hypothetical protein
MQGSYIHHDMYITITFYYFHDKDFIILKCPNLLGSRELLRY